MTERNSSEATTHAVGPRTGGALRDVDIDDARDALRQAQSVLAALGYEMGNHGDPAQAIDGIWGDRTRQAVLAFQTDQGLTRTGQLDEATTSALWVTQTDAMEVEATEVPDEDGSLDEAELILSSTDRQSMHEVLDGIEPTDSEADVLLSTHENGHQDR